MITVDDALRRPITFGAAPRRVVSLVPSDSFSVAVLAPGALVGRTDYCEMPADTLGAPPDAIAKAKSVGGTKNPRIEDIVALAPDLVIANKEENTQKDLAELVQKHGIKVYVCFPQRAAEGIAHFARLARIFRVEREARVRELFKQAYAAIASAEQARATTTPLRTFCPIWMKPLMTINGETFMSDVLDLAGAQNVFADRERRYPLAADLGKATPLGPDEIGARDTRYPRVTLDEVTERSPELVLLPDEPHPFTEEDAAVFRGLPLAAKVVKTPGKDLSWYGAQTIGGLSRVRALVDSIR